MKALLFIALLAHITPFSKADTNSAIAQFDKLLASRAEVSARTHTDREIEDICRKLVVVAYEDLTHKDVVFSKGIDRRWAERLPNLSQSPTEAVLRNKDVAIFAEQVQIFADESKPPLGAHLLQRCWISRVVAVYFSKNGNYESAKHQIETSTSYLDLMEELMADEIAKKKAGGFMKKSRAENRALFLAIEAKLGTRQELAQNDNRPASSTHPPSEGPKTPAAVTKTFTVTHDVRANQTGNESGARGEGALTVRGEDGTFAVRYWYDYPSSYLITSSRGTSLKKKTVSIHFNGDKAKYISCGAGSGRCEIKSFSRQ